MRELILGMAGLLLARHILYDAVSLVLANLDNEFCFQSEGLEYKQNPSVQGVYFDFVEAVADYATSHCLLLIPL